LGGDSSQASGVNDDGQLVGTSLTSSGEDYYVMTSVERFGRPAGGVISIGHLAMGKVMTVPIALTRFVFLPLVIR
jgi:hypothetical protein